jgi:ribonuclease J
MSKLIELFNMNICIHRGAKEIGGSCVELESQGQRLLLDLGLPLDAENNDPKYLPDIKGLDGKDPSFLGILISHPHVDHFGLLAHISEDIPVGMGAAARRILKAAKPFMPGKWPVPVHGWDYESEVPFEIGPFTITPYLVDHSAYDAYALMIEADGKRLFYSGDFRAHGRKSSLFERMIANPLGNIDVMLLEGSSLGRLDDDSQFPTETDLETKFETVFRETSGLAMVHCSSQNIDRIVSVMRASKRTGRKLVIDLYTAAILEATGNPKLPQSYWSDVVLMIPHSQRVKIKKNGWFDLLKQHSANRIFREKLNAHPEQYTLLFRPLYQGDMTRGECLEGAVYVYSQWEGYWERGEYDDVEAWLNEHSIMKQSIHTSGHASPVDLKRLVKALNPGKVVPIHTFHPKQYEKMYPNVEVHEDGEWW